MTSIATTFAAVDNHAPTSLTRIGTPGSEEEGFFRHVPGPIRLTMLLRRLGMEDALCAA